MEVVAWISVVECGWKAGLTESSVPTWIFGGLACFIGTAPLYALLVGLGLAGIKYVSKRMFRTAPRSAKRA